MEEAIGINNILIGIYMMGASLIIYILLLAFQTFT
jgi:hypothetical protein